MRLKDESPYYTAEVVKESIITYKKAWKQRSCCVKIDFVS